MSDQLREFPKLETPEIEAERLRWHSLVLRVAAREETADWEFRNHYAAGIRVMLRRSLSSIGLEALVDETLAGALEEVRRGSIREPLHFVQFVRSVIERQQQGEAMSPKLARVSPALTTGAHALRPGVPARSDERGTRRTAQPATGNGAASPR